MPESANKKPVTLVGCDRLNWRLLRLVFELRDQTFTGFNVIARAEINRLIQGKAIPVGVEEAHLDDSADWGDFMIGRDGNIAARNQAPPLEQADLKRTPQACARNYHTENHETITVC